MSAPLSTGGQQRSRKSPASSCRGGPKLCGPLCFSLTGDLRSAMDLAAADTPCILAESRMTLSDGKADLGACQRCVLEWLLQSAYLEGAGYLLKVLSERQLRIARCRLPGPFTLHSGGNDPEV